MRFYQWALVLTATSFFSIPWVPAIGMEVNVGNIRVQTAPNGELYVDTSRGRIYLPPDDDYYEDGDYYEDDYDYYYDDDYCSGRQVTQRTVQSSQSGRQESYSSVYTSSC